MYDYVAGKLDWLAAGLPTEGTNAAHPRAGDLARRDVPTCSVDEILGDVRQRVAAAGWEACVVVSADRLVFGLLRAAELDGDPARRIDKAMRPGPSTYRPYVAVEEIAKAMADKGLDSFPITTSDGKLVGLIRRGDLGDAATS